MGFDVTRFVKCDDLDDFKCTICLEIWKEPVFVRGCEHVFCRECIGYWMQRGNSCPEDRKTIERADLIEPNRFFRNLYGRLQIKCEFAEVMK